MTKKIAVILSGCGVYDGAEIHEATLSLLAIDQVGASYQCFAPDIDQMHVVNHITGEEMNGTRNVLVESARIARGDIKALSEFNASEFDALLLPGGFGAAKNLSSFAVDGESLVVNTDIYSSLCSMHRLGKPIGALCISPVILAKVFDGAKVTVGMACDASEVINTIGADHVVTTHGDVVVDENLNLITSPCYMLDASISQIYDGAQGVIKEILARI